jgi:hypothetical protein
MAPMNTIIEWIKRIIRIGIFEFLMKLGWRVWLGLAVALFGLTLLVIFLIMVVIGLLF